MKFVEALLKKVEDELGSPERRSNNWGVLNSVDHHDCKLARKQESILLYKALNVLIEISSQS